jgi:chromosome segregation ATPase
MVSLLTHDKKNITQKFFEEVAIQVRRSFEHANRDAEVWLRAIMAPMETQVREHQIQLKRRLESIKRIHQATDTLEDRIAELEGVENNLQQQIEALEDIVGRVQDMLMPLRRCRQPDGIDFIGMEAHRHPQPKGADEAPA